MDTLNIPYHDEIKILGVTFASYHRAPKEQELGGRNRQDECPGKAYIRAGLKHLTTGPLCAGIRPSDNMAYGPGVPATHDVYPTIDDCYRMVHMEGSKLPGTNIDSTVAEDTRRLGLN